MKEKEKELLMLMIAEQKSRDAEVTEWIPLVREGLDEWNLLIEKIGSALPLACGYNVTLKSAVGLLKADLKEECKKQMLAKVRAHT